MELTPTSLTFADQAVGTTSAGQTVTLTNTLPSATITISDVSITGVDAGDYAQTNTCGTPVAAGGSCTISVTFTPTAVGTRTASVSISDDSDVSPQTVPLTGTTGVTLAPTSLTFAGQTVGTTSAALPVTLTNSGGSALTITSISITGSDPTEFAQTNTCGTSVAAGASCTINVTFTPAAAGTRSASVSIADNAPDNPQTVTLTGTGATGPAAGLAPSTITFSSQAVGSTSSPQVATLSNNGGSTLTISSIGITGPFGQTNTCGASLSAGGSCTFSITFSPTASGSATGALTLSDNASPGTQTVTLNGTGTASPLVSLSPGSLTFAAINVGSTSTPQTVTLTNSGNGTLTLTSVAITGANGSDFTYTTTGCGSGASLPPGASCALIVYFKPTTTGSRSAAITLTDNAPGSPQTVALSGTGITTPGASLSPASLTFSSQAVGSTSPIQTVTVTNTGSATLTISSMSITNSNFGQTAIGKGSCAGGTSLAAGASCTMSVYFKPGVTGTAAGSLLVADNAPGTPQAVALTGTAVAPGVGLQPSSLVFKGEPLNTASAPQDVTLTNTGTAALSISSIAFTGSGAADFSQTNNCPMSSGATLSAGATCEIGVVFKPTASGNLSAALTVTDNAPGSPHSVSVSGAGSGFALTAPTSSASVSPGQSATYALNFAPTGGFSGSVTVSCTTTAPAASCTVAPTTLALNAPNVATATATVATTANGAAPLKRRLTPGPGPWLWLAFAGMIALAFGLLASAPRRSRWALAGALVVLLSWAGCGGGSSTTSSSGPPSTPAGTYQVTVTAKSATASQNVTLTLTVQ